MSFSRARLVAGITVLLLGLAGTTPLLPAADTQAATAKNVSVDGSKKWVDTGMDVTAGDKLHITATGTVDFSDKKGVTPAGAPREWKDTLRDLMLLSAGRGALVGQVSNDRAATPFLVGADGTITVMSSGRLFLGVNQDSLYAATGAYEAHIQRTPAAKSTTTATNYNFQPLYKILDANLPYRVTDQAAPGGNEGDLVNFVLVGSEEKVTAAFKEAGWILPDKTNQAAVVSALIATLNKQAYTTVPMSTLFLFGRSQDYGFARAEAVKVIGERDHFRIWKAPFKGPNGETLWAGAGTHDIGIEKDQRKEGAITHKIDANVDGERDFISQTLQDMGAVQATGYLDRPKQIKETKTATGGEIKSDGRTLVTVLK
ncbi:MAG TPA: LssY C-terminal domain-containing protein [Candidatus Angelobacter sp.]|nr:LssY C-terminal domain-containing protein [Candidatus Angelobacter sp.]